MNIAAILQVSFRLIDLKFKERLLNLLSNYALLTRKQSGGI